MMKFGLACEGVTDQAVIENILCGFYNDRDLRSEIKPFQPLFDATQQKQLDGEFGGWEELLKYLSTKRFRETVINTEYMIIQIDTDISERKNFDVSQHNLSTEELIEKVIQRLIININKLDFFRYSKLFLDCKWIEKKQQSILVNHQMYLTYQNTFYKKNQEKIIFAISVHSLECWILPIYRKDRKEKITGCIEALDPKTKNENYKKNYKNYNNYRNLSKKFLKHKELIKFSSKNRSFETFIDNLPKEI